MAGKATKDAVEKGLKITCDDIIKKRMELWREHEDIEKDQAFREAAAQKLISPEGEALRDAVKRFPEKLIEMFFVIVDKDLNTLPFILNEVQKEFIKILNQAKIDFEAGKRNRLWFLVLKGRQQGFTSIITAYQLACTIVTRNFSGFTIADTSDNSNTIFEDKAKYPYGQLPEPIKPREKANNRREMIFEKLNSKWRVSTAGNKEAGRSKTLNFFHGSEAAFWDSISSIIAGLGSALTNKCVAILETTANGYNEYRQLWREAEAGENNWTPLFFEWWKTSEYRLNFESKDKEKEFKSLVNNPIGDFPHKLYWLLTEKHLDWQQLYWYYAKWKDLKEKLPQEYPCTANEAFLSSGASVFDNQKLEVRLNFLEQHYKEKEHKPIRGRFKYKYVNEKIVDDSITFVIDDSGPVIVYEMPIPGYPYVIGGDTAEGGRDYCVGQVVNNITGADAAKWRGRTDTDIFAKQMYCLGYMYNWALIGIETNFDTHPVKELNRLGYPKQYLRQAMDDIKGSITLKYGFWTGQGNRGIIIGDLVSIVRDETILIKDIDTIKEMLVFIDNDGKWEAASGEHDDCVMSRAIANAIRGQQSNKVVVEEVKPKPLPHALQSNNNGEVSVW